MTLRPASTAAALLIVVPCCLAQLRLTDLRGKIISGAYHTTAEDYGKRDVTFVPLTLDLQTAGYLAHPDFLSFEIKPVLTSGPQATEAGFLGGNGVSLTTDFLRRRSFPLRFFYNNLRREDVYYGGLTQVSGYTSRTHDVNYGLNWDWRPARWPKVSLDWRRTNLVTQPNTPSLPEFATRSSQAGVQVTDERWGWNLHANARRDGFSTEYSYLSGDSFSLSHWNQTNSRIEGGGSRPVWKGGSLSLSGSNQSIRSSSGGYLFDQNFRILNAALSSGSQKRLRGGVRANYVAGALGSRLGGPGNAMSSSGTALLPQETVLETLASQSYSNLSASGDMNYRLGWGWEAYFIGNQGKVWTPPSRTSFLRYDYATATAGVRFEHRVTPWAQVTGDVHAMKGRTTYEQNEPGKIQGTGYSVRLHSGDPSRLEGSVSYNEQKQRLDHTAFTSNRSNSRWGDLNVSRDLRRLGLSLTAGGGLNDSSFTSFNSDFQGKGYSLNANVRHRFVQAAYSKYYNSGNTLSSLLAIAGGGVGGSVFLPAMALPTLKTTQRGETITGRISPMRRLDLTFYYIHVNQEMNSAPLNEFRQILATITYRFRLLEFQAGYAKWEQSLFGAPNVLRDRMYVRVTRPFTVFGR